MKMRALQNLDNDNLTDRVAKLESIIDDLINRIAKLETM